MDADLPAAVELVVAGRARSIGPFDVTRVLPARRRRNVGPFVFLDHMGPLRLAPGEGFDVPPHPHIGLSTVTYLYEGELVHRDSVGSEQTISPGAINLMCAGRGIVHSERTGPADRARGPALHGLQLWVALPLAAEQGEPSFHHHPADALPAWSEHGAEVRLLMGALGDRRSPVEDPSTPLFVDVVLPAGTRYTVPAGVPECAVYVAVGALRVDGVPFAEHSLIVRAPGAPLVIEAAVDARVALLGGRPLDAPRFMEWNYVSSSRETIARAAEDWKAGRFPAIPY